MVYVLVSSASLLEKKFKQTRLIVCCCRCFLMCLTYFITWFLCGSPDPQNGRDSCGCKAEGTSKRSHNAVTGKVLKDCPTPCSFWSFDFEGKQFFSEKKIWWREKAWNGDNSRIRRDSQGCDWVLFYDDATWSFKILGPL